jgi:hypothetical protein
VRRPKRPVGAQDTCEKSPAVAGLSLRRADRGKPLALPTLTETSSGSGLSRCRHGGRHRGSANRSAALANLDGPQGTLRFRARRIYLPISDDDARLGSRSLSAFRSRVLHDVEVGERGGGKGREAGGEHKHSATHEILLCCRYESARDDADHHVSALRQRLAKKCRVPVPPHGAIRFSSSMFALHGATNASAVIAFPRNVACTRAAGSTCSQAKLHLQARNVNAMDTAAIRGTPLGVCRQGRHEVAILRAVRRCRTRKNHGCSGRT